MVVGSAYVALVRVNTKFRNCSGISTNMSLLGGMQVNSESVTSILVGGVAVATPDNAQMGSRVNSGAAFELADKSEEAGWKGHPTIPL